MPCLQPEIMIVDGLHQNGPHTAAIGAQGIGEDLISHQSGLGSRDAVFGKAFFDTLGKRLFRMGDAVKTILPAEFGDPVVMTVGHDTHRNIALCHHGKPGRHFLRGDAGGVGNDGIVEVQHQKPDVLIFQPLGMNVGKGVGHHRR